jgi:hypothetical protein
MKSIFYFLFVVFIFGIQTCFGQQLFVEDFNYIAGTRLNTHGWTAYSEAGILPQL